MLGNISCSKIYTHAVYCLAPRKRGFFFFYLTKYYYIQSFFLMFTKGKILKSQKAAALLLKKCIFRQGLIKPTLIVLLQVNFDALRIKKTMQPFCSHCGIQYLINSRLEPCDISHLNWLLTLPRRKTRLNYYFFYLKSHH